MNGFLRKATEEDMDLLFNWCNDPVVRKNSFSTTEISYAEHMEWYKKILNRSDCRQYIYMYENKAIGQARITITGEIAEVGYSICADKRHMGHGKNLLKLIKQQVALEFPQIKKIIGKVKTKNVVSQQAFISAGYSEVYKVFEIEME